MNIPRERARAAAEACARARFPRSVADLAELIRFPSVSADPKRRAAVAGCARWLAGHLEGIGLDGVRVLPTAGNPIVVAESRAAVPAPTVLIYGHYDVQPAEPGPPWTSPPFEPKVRDGVIHGRGASDDKGQIMAHVKAIEAWLCGARRLPVNVKLLVEGEEEIGSPSLPAFLRRHRRALAADVAVLSDMPLPDVDRPALTYALRGAFAAEIIVHGPRADLHSGIFGGFVPNPLEALARILGTLHDARGRVAVPGFYDAVASVSAAELSHLRQVGPRDEDLLRRAGAQATHGEPGYSAHELATIRPTLEINGVSGGYQGPGPKSVIPALATAKLSARLVPDQDPRAVERLLRDHVARHTPPGVHAEVRAVLHAAPVVVDPRHPAMIAADHAYRAAFGVAPTHARSGGTVPAASLFQEILGIPPLLMGFGLASDQAHGPDEGFSLEAYQRGIAASIHLYAELDRLPFNRGAAARRAASATPGR
ncbi:dipeptidase [Sorangium sp. So ce726]|uniref:dipeptidase n=1 Tax=Sorangium sp. So ce726 TaxID=3133319 RepID=UPI003F5E4F73